MALTERQREILQLAAAGLSNGEIAAALEIAEHSVKNHMSNIYTRLAADGRVAAIMIAAGLGLVDLRTAIAIAWQRAQARRDYETGD